MEGGEGAVGAVAVTMVSGGTITTITGVQDHKRALDTTITGITTVGTIELLMTMGPEHYITSSYCNYHFSHGAESCT